MITGNTQGALQVALKDPPFGVKDKAVKVSGLINSRLKLYVVDIVCIIIAVCPVGVFVCLLCFLFR